MTKVMTNNNIVAQYNKHKIKDMTYILGSKCSDGVVLIGDRRVVSGDGSSHEYEDKIFMVDPWMIVGSSGTLALFQKFRDQITEYVASPNCERTVAAIINEIETTTGQLNASYHELLQGHDFDVLLGIKSTVGSVLQYVYPYGLAEGVSKYKVIGHGEPYGVFFLKRWWKPDMAMLDVAELGFFIIKYIHEFELDNTVGIGDENPQILLIPKQPIPEGAPPEVSQSPHPHPLSEKDMQDMKIRVRRRIAKFKRTSWSML